MKCLKCGSEVPKGTTHRCGIVPKAVMKEKDRACFNCEASKAMRIPNVGATSEADHMGLCSCKQRLSSHFEHVLLLTHVCEWHSDTVCTDPSYPHWKESIET